MMEHIGNIFFKIGFIVGIIILLTAIFSGCSDKEIILGKGKINFINFKEGFYGITSENGEKYEPLNLPDDFKEDYLNISFKVIIVKNQLGYHNWGKVVYILEIKKIEVKGDLIGYTDCKEFKENNLSISIDCIEYDYDGEKILRLKHVNAGFNCCPKITSNIDICGNLITIKEIEISGDCDCLCLYDLSYEISNLNHGKYLITVEEPYLLEGDEILEFTVNLSSSPTGSFCVYRYHYPWW